MRTSSGAWNWTVIVPVALVLLAVAAIIALDATKEAPPNRPRRSAKLGRRCGRRTSRLRRRRWGSR